MSVEKMKFVNIVGPIERFDEFVLHYIIDRQIQLEHAFNQVPNYKALRPYYEENPYDSLLKTLENVNRTMKVGVKACHSDELCTFAKEPFDAEGARKYLCDLEERFTQFEQELEIVKQEINENRQILKQLLPLRNLQFNMDGLFHLEYLKIRFGKLPKESYAKLDIVLAGLHVVVVPFSSDGNDVWVSYFMPSSVSKKIDNIMSSLYFERVWISEKVKGKPAAAIEDLEQENQHLERHCADLEQSYMQEIEAQRDTFEKMYGRAIYMHGAYNVRKYAAHTQETFYITGWMPEKAYRTLAHELEKREDITVTVEEPEEVRGLKPPTILKNNRFFKPFESIIKMYGVPAHNEIDPTVLVAITYIFMFGVMFGDVGQGAILCLAGLGLFYYKKSALGWVIACVGVSSVTFGFLYGSIFGNEEYLPAVWKAPMDNISQLLILSIGYGAIIILMTIIINIMNSIKAKDYGRLFFDKNGLAGLVFYGGILTAILYALILQSSISIPLIAGILMIPLLLMLFKEQLEKKLLKRHHGTGGGFIEGFFEVFEAVLGFLSNTVSFVRVSAFALSHAGLALAFWTLYDMIGGFGGVIVLIIGNALIIGLEGLIVGIQCLRLQYYEMFSRFFSGDGREFEPIRVYEKSNG